MANEGFSFWAYNGSQSTSQPLKEWRDPMSVWETVQGRLVRFLEGEDIIRGRVRGINVEKGGNMMLC